jgi:hypothetical protein
VNQSFTYHPNFADNFHGLVLGLWGTRARTIRSGLTCLMFGVFSALLFWVLGMPPGAVAPAALLFAVAWGLFVTVVIGGWQAGILTRRQRAIGPAQIHVSDAGVERITRTARVTHAWDAIAFVDETTRAFFLYDAIQPLFAIEKSALRRPGEVEALRQFLRERKPGNYAGP